MNKKYLTLILTITLISLISAVSIAPTTIKINQQINQEKSYTINITNDKDFPISNIKFSNLSNYGFSFPEISIPNKTTIQTKITLNPLQIFSGKINSIVSFKYNASVPTQVTTYNIEITNNGFSKTFLTIRAGDSIAIKNSDTIVHNFNSNITGDHPILPGETYSYKFNQKGNYEFKDTSWQEFPNFKGQISVIDRNSNELVHNPQYDFIQVFDINIFNKPTILEVTLQETSFNVTSTGNTQGIVKVKNIGENSAVNTKIGFDTEWINAKENGFNLEPGEQKFVVFTIVPLIFNTNETNKTYNFNMDVGSSNTGNFTSKLNVTIPYDNSFDDPDSQNSIFSNLNKAIEAYCKKHPLDCSGNTTSTQSNNSNSNFNINETQEGYEQTKRDVADVKTQTSQNTKTLNDINQKLNLLDNINKTAFNAWMEEQRNKESHDTTIVTTSLIIFFTIICICIGILFRGHNKMKKIDAMKTGRIKPRGFGI